jgi:hypothetical protein
MVDYRYLLVSRCHSLTLELVTNPVKTINLLRTRRPLNIAENVQEVV